MKIAQNIFPLIVVNIFFCCYNFKKKLVEFPYKLQKVQRNLFLKTWFVIISESKGSKASGNCTFLFILPYNSGYISAFKQKDSKIWFKVRINDVNEQ